MQMPRFLTKAAPQLSEEEQRRLLAQVQANSEQPKFAPPMAPPEPVVAEPPQQPGPTFQPTVLTDRNREAITRPRTVAPPEDVAAPAPGDPAMGTRERTVTPPAVAPPGPHVIYGDEGQPRRAEGGETDYDRDQAYLQALQRYKPENHNSKLRSAGLGFARGLQGFKGQSLLGSLIDPAADERFANEVEIGRVGRSVEEERASRASASKAQSEEQDRKLKDAQAQKALRDPTYAPHYLDTDQGPMVANGNQATPIYNPEGKAVGPKAKPARTKVFFNAENGHAETWSVDDDGKKREMISGSDPKQDLVKRDGMWVGQGTALTAGALEGNRKYQRGRDTMEDNRRATERTEDQTQKNMDRGEQRRTASAKLVGAIEGGRNRAEAATKKINELKTQLAQETNPQNKLVLQQSLDGWKYEREKALNEATSAASELNSGYGDMYESGPGEQDSEGAQWPYVKKRPLSFNAWKKKYPRATKAQEEAWRANAAAAGMDVGP